MTVRKSTGLRIWLSRLFRVILVVAFVPVLLVPVYAVIPPVSTLMIADLVLLRGFTRDWTRLDDISKNLQHAVVMAEDGKYCSHWGVDWDSLFEVISDEDGPSRGASTISMQTVKNLFLWNSRSYVRKGLEIPLALYADFVWSKRRMLEIYLNIAEWGPGLYGAEAAAQAYFGKSAKDLSRRQAALLVSALPNPLLRNPGKPTSAQSRYARIVERRAAQAGGYVDCLAPPG